MSGSKLTERVRNKAFACLLRQEIAYFDRPENNSGVICARLSADALSLQDMSGTRLGLIVEMIGTFIFGIALGSWFSWRLTLIVCVFVFLMFIVGVFDIRIQAHVNSAAGLIYGRASSVRGHS